jgi:transposase
MKNQRMCTSYVPVMHNEKMAATNTFRQRAVTEFLVKEGNSAAVIYERLRSVYGDACMGVSSVRRWVKHFKDGNTDIADQPRCDPQRTAATERNKRKVDELIRQERKMSEKLQRSLEWGAMRSGR